MFTRDVKFPERLLLPVQGNLYPAALVIGNIDNDPSGDNEIAAATIDGNLSIFKGMHYLYTGKAHDEITVIENPTTPDLNPWATAHNLGTITCMSLARIRPLLTSLENAPRYFKDQPRLYEPYERFQSLLAINAEGELHIFDIDADRFCLYRSEFLQLARERMQVQLQNARGLELQKAYDYLKIYQKNSVPYDFGIQRTLQWSSKAISDALKADRMRQSFKRTIADSLRKDNTRPHVIQPTMTFKIPFDAHFMLTADLDGDGYTEVYIATAAPALHVLKFHYAQSEPPSGSQVIPRSYARLYQDMLNNANNRASVDASSTTQALSQLHSQYTSTSLGMSVSIEFPSVDDAEKSGLDIDTPMSNTPNLVIPRLDDEVSYAGFTEVMTLGDMLSESDSACSENEFDDWVEDQEENEATGEGVLFDEPLRPPPLEAWIPTDLIKQSPHILLPGAIVSMSASFLDLSLPLFSGFNITTLKDGKVPVLYLGTEAGAYIAFWADMLQRSSDLIESLDRSLPVQRELVLRMMIADDRVATSNKSIADSTSNVSEKEDQPQPPPIALSIAPSTFSRRTFIIPTTACISDDSTLSKPSSPGVVVCSGVGQLAALNLEQGFDATTSALPPVDRSSRLSNATEARFMHRLPAFSALPLGGRIMHVTTLQTLWDPYFDPKSDNAPPLSLPRIPPALREPQIVVCRWDGVTYFGPSSPFFQKQSINIENGEQKVSINTTDPSIGLGGARRQLLLRFQFGERIRAFAAGTFTLVPGVTIPAFCYVTFRGTLAIVLLEHLDCRLASGGHASLGAADAFIDAVVQGNFKIPTQEMLLNLKFGSDAISAVNDLAYGLHLKHSSVVTQSEKINPVSERKRRKAGMIARKSSVDSIIEEGDESDREDPSQDGVSNDFEDENTSVAAERNAKVARESHILEKGQKTRHEDLAQKLKSEEKMQRGAHSEALAQSKNQDATEKPFSIPDLLAELKTSSQLPLTSASSQEELDLMIRQQAEIVRLAKLSKSSSEIVNAALDLLFYFKLQSDSEKQRASALEALRRRERKTNVQMDVKMVNTPSSQQVQAKSDAQAQPKISHRAQKSEPSLDSHQQIEQTEEVEDDIELNEGGVVGRSGTGEMTSHSDNADQAPKYQSQLSGSGQLELRLIGVHGQLRMRPDEYLWLRPGLVDPSDDLVAWLAASQRYFPILREASLWASSPQRSGTTVARMILSVLGVEQLVVGALKRFRQRTYEPAALAHSESSMHSLAQLMRMFNRLQSRLGIVRTLKTIVEGPRPSSLLLLQSSLLKSQRISGPSLLSNQSEEEQTSSENGSTLPVATMLQDASETLPFDYLLAIQEHPSRNETSRALRTVRRSDPATLLAYRDALALLARAQVDERAIARQEAFAKSKKNMRQSIEFAAVSMREQWTHECGLITSILSTKRISRSPIALLAPTAALEAMQDRADAVGEKWVPFEARPFLPTSSLDASRDKLIGSALERFASLTKISSRTRASYRKSRRSSQRSKVGQPEDT